MPKANVPGEPVAAGLDEEDELNNNDALKKPDGDFEESNDDEIVVEAQLLSEPFTPPPSDADDNADVDGLYENKGDTDACTENEIKSDSDDEIV